MHTSHGEKESEREQYQVKLDAERTLAHRNEWGQHATPLPLAISITTETLKNYPTPATLDFLEPSIGSGAFFSALLQSLPAERVRHAVGYEIDSSVALTATKVWRDTALTVRLEDFMRAEPQSGEQFDLVLANPPYTRHHHLSATDKIQLQSFAASKLGILTSGLSGLYLYFILKTDQWLAPNAISAWLVPTEWMNVNYGQALKQYLLEHVELLRVHAFHADDTQFADALVSSSIVWFRKAKPDPQSRVVFSSGVLSAPSFVAEIGRKELNVRNKWLGFCLEPMVTASADGPLIGDLFIIRRGIATGSNPFFVRPLAEWEKLSVPRVFLVPVLPPARRLSDRKIKARTDGFPDLGEPLALLDCPLEPEEVRTTLPQLWNVLTSPDGQAVSATYLASSRRPWYSQEKRLPAPLVCSYMGRGRNGASPFKIFANDSQAIATNGYLMLYPRAELKEYVAQGGDAINRVRETLEAIVSKWYASHGRVYGGGLHKLEPKELGSIPAKQFESDLGIRSGSSSFPLNL